MAPHLGDSDWRYQLQKSQQRKDPEKLMALVAQLCSALDERKARPQWQHDEPRPFASN